MTNSPSTPNQWSEQPSPFATGLPSAQVPLSGRKLGVDARVAGADREHLGVVVAVLGAVRTDVRTRVEHQPRLGVGDHQDDPCSSISAPPTPGESIGMVPRYSTLGDGNAHL